MFNSMEMQQSFDKQDIFNRPNGN